MRTHTLAVQGLMGLSVMGIVACTCLAQQGVAEKSGQRLDEVGRGLRRGAYEVTEVVRKRFDVVRTDVQRMEAQSRVYSRLHWDKALNSGRIEVHMLRDGTVLLRGQVPDSEAKNRAVALARDTVGVSAVIDELSPLVPTWEGIVPARSR
jgi:hyperosmotically inducible periplasmic protein